MSGRPDEGDAPAPPDAAPGRAAAWIDRPEALAALAARLARAERVALDTEANSLHAYRERVCVVQVTTAEESALIDPLALPDLEPLRAALGRPEVEVVLHGGDYDVAVLSRDHGFTFTRVFDTHVAATLLGEARVGLADLVGYAFGVTLDKRFQTADWARRPLSGEHLEYLAADTRWLLPLRDRLAAALAAQDLWEEAEIEFRRLAARRGKPLSTDPEGWRRLKGAGELSAAGRAVLHALWAWREAEAQRRDVPPFKVLAPQALVSLAQRPEALVDPRAPLAGLHPREASRHGRAVREAVVRGLLEAQAGRAPAAPERPRPSEDERQRRRLLERREDALRAWRKAEAVARGVPTVVVLPNPALDWLVAQDGVDLASLAAHPDVGPKRAARYGADLLRVHAAAS